MRHERGEGRIGSLLFLVVLLAGAYATWNVAPVYIANYSMKDKMLEVARQPRTTNDDKVRDMLMHEASEDGLVGVVQRNTFQILTYETGRRIICNYSRTVDILPGWTHTFVFLNQVDQPMAY